MFFSFPFVRSFSHQPSVASRQLLEEHLDVRGLKKEAASLTTDH
jgi:hypothetical protein